MTDNEIAIRAAINILRDSVESGRMPSGEKLPPESSAVHAKAAEHFEAVLRTIGSRSAMFFAPPSMEPPAENRVTADHRNHHTAPA